MNGTKHISSPHVPMRQCVGCRGREPKRAMLRVGVVEGRPTIDLKRRLSGRGAYVHARAKCVSGATRRGNICRSLRIPVDRSLAVALQRAIDVLNHQMLAGLEPAVVSPPALQANNSGDRDTRLQPQSAVATPQPKEQ